MDSHFTNFHNKPTNGKWDNIPDAYKLLEANDPLDMVSLPMLFDEGYKYGWCRHPNPDS